ncbi:GNAT family N-acetyltransferase [Pseudomonas sp. KNUC1026]|uniref:GNAT family N-acetyltransferase n=1 Tax=Pseudomonas sp. KNUC1026 TaxID=2893890 RepID=UPI001F36E56E|nr:GNAT family N-acetyltransferase [Pseudomonas sp. KNUC1026]UFH50599.1 GNAT family N-acetyltransferase [Pseudomonas sp. KNUC1026]
MDIAVLPDHQGKGLGKRIMAEILKYIDAQVPESGYVSLIADGPAQHLYAQFGFTQTAPHSVGMAYRKSGQVPPAGNNGRLLKGGSAQWPSELGPLRFEYC